MKKEINPVVMFGVIAVVVIGIAIGLWRAVVAKPSYPGAGAPRAGGAPTPTGPMTGAEAARRGISGVNPNQMPGGGGGAPR